MQSWKERLGFELSEVSYTEKSISTAGGIVAIFLVLLFSHLGVGGLGGSLVVASMGASAVLLFAVPHGQLSQPWPVIAGHGFSALIGVLCSKYIGSQDVAAACAVGLSIGAMHQFKCIHPPGGATALTAVVGGQTIHDLGFSFVLCPILINAVLMVALAVLLNACFRWRRYPAFLMHRPQSPSLKTDPTHEEIVAALKSLDSFVDITEDDLIRLCQILSARPSVRRQARKAESALV